MKAYISVKTLLFAIRRLPPDPPVHNPRKWYLTQHEHWIRWLSEYSGAGAYGRRTGIKRSAQFAYNHVVQPEMLLYLAGVSGVNRNLVVKAKRAFKNGSSLSQRSGAIRAIIPWETVAAALWGSE